MCNEEEKCVSFVCEVRGFMVEHVGHSMLPCYCWTSSAALSYSRAATAPRLHLRTVLVFSVGEGEVAVEDRSPSGSSLMTDDE